MHNKEGDNADCVVTAICDVYSGFSSRRAITTQGGANELEEDDVQCHENGSREDADELTDVLAAMRFADKDDAEDTADSGDSQLHAYVFGDDV